MPILRSIQYVTFKYGDVQKASRISLREPSIYLLTLLLGVMEICMYESISNNKVSGLWEVQNFVPSYLKSSLHENR